MSFLTDYLAKHGTLPPISMTIQPLSGARPITLNRFLSYQFDSSVLVPIDTFSFTAVAPDDPIPLSRQIQEGDIVMLSANGYQLCTGIIDQTDVQYDVSEGEKVTISGRNLLAQLEDQDAVSLDATPLYAGNYTPSQVLQKLITDTRIQGYHFQQAPSKAYLFATEPGETKLQALTRYIDPLNCLVWMDPSGKLVFGRPNMAQAALSRIYCIKSSRQSNVTSIRAARNSTQIPNIVVPVWTGQENVQAIVGKETALVNSASGPNRLAKLGHRVVKAVVVSTPQGTSAQELADVNTFTVGNANLLQAYAKRELARQNFKELQVEAVIPGHYTESGVPFMIDQTHTIQYERADVNERMYLYQVSYSLTPESGQKTTLHFCKLGCIVSDVRAK